VRKPCSVVGAEFGWADRQKDLSAADLHRRTVTSPFQNRIGRRETGDGAEEANAARYLPLRQMMAGLPLRLGKDCDFVAARVKSEDNTSTCESSLETRKSQRLKETLPTSYRTNC